MALRSGAGASTVGCERVGRDPTPTPALPRAAQRLLVRLRSWPRIGGRGMALALALAGLGALATRNGALVAALLGASGVGLLLRAGFERVAATRAVLGVVAPAVESAGGRQRPSDFALLRRLATELRPRAVPLAALFALSLLATPLALLTPLPIKIAVDNAVAGAPLPELARRLLPSAADPLGALGLAVGLVLAHGLLVCLQSLALGLVETRVGERLVLEFRARLFEHLQRPSLARHDEGGGADAAHHIERGAPAIRDVVVGGAIPLLGSAVTLAATIGVTAAIQPRLAGVALGITPVLYLLARSARRRRRARRSKLKGGFDRLVGLTVAAGTAAALFVGIPEVQAGTLRLGSLLVVISYLAQLYGPLKAISKRVAGLQESLVSAERAFALLDQPTEVRERPAARPIARARGEVEFRDVAFGHDPRCPVLEGVDVAVAQGVRVAIVGPSGAGTTTLVSLLLRFRDPTAGRILLDGVDLRDYRLRDLRRQFAIVRPEPVLFSASVAANIACGRPGASVDQIVAAARAAGAHDFIAALPGGYEIGRAHV